MWENMPSAIDTAAKRAKLAPRKNPYWQGISGGRGGVSLGFRARSDGRGSWVAKIAVEGQRYEESLGAASHADCLLEGALEFPGAVAAALAWGKRQAQSIRAGVTLRAGDAPTVKSAVETYIAVRRGRAGRNGSEAQLKRYVLSDDKFAGAKLARLNATDIEKWRGRLPASLAPTTKNRILNDLRAALNAAALSHRQLLPAHLLLEIKVGTKAEEATSEGRRQLLTDGQVRAIVNAAFEVDTDFGHLVLLAAVTGARFSQLIKITVADVQIRNARIMVPSSKKGRNRKPRPKVAVPVGEDTLKLLTSAVERCSGEGALLQRWTYRREGPPGRWVKKNRQDWQKAFETLKFWRQTAKAADVPADTVMYALRHSSIVRGLLAGLPVRLVAALHDTSTKMIETHYSAYILDVSADLARKGALSLAQEQNQILEAAE